MSFLKIKQGESLKEYLARSINNKTVLPSFQAKLQRETVLTEYFKANKPEDVALVDAFDDEEEFEEEYLEEE